MTSYGELVTRNEKTLEVYQVVKHVGGCEKILLESIEFGGDFLFKHYTFANKKDKLEVEVGDGIVLMQFCIQGEYTFKNEQQKKLANFKSSESNILFIPNKKLLITRSSEEVEFVNIYLKRDFFVRFIQMGFSNSKDLSINSFQTFFPRNISLTPKIKNVLTEITICDFDEHLKNLFIRAKIIELLTLLLAQFEEEKNNLVLLKPIEIERMMMVKELIENNLHESYSLSSLARTAGTNEQYLKKHFKMMFGNTVFGYILSYKMQKAKEMLLTGKYRITEISEIVGYKHATHFTSAFKKFFGCLPQSFKVKMFLGGYFSFALELEVLEMLMMV